MARASRLSLVAALLLGSLALASGFAVSPGVASLNRLTVQRTIHDLGANKQELNPYGLVLIQKSSVSSQCRCKAPGWAGHRDAVAVWWWAARWARQRSRLTAARELLASRVQGKLVKGNFLATQWNDVNNNPGTCKRAPPACSCAPS